MGIYKSSRSLLPRHDDNVDPLFREQSLLGGAPRPHLPTTTVRIRVRPAAARFLERADLYHDELASVQEGMEGN